MNWYKIAQDGLSYQEKYGRDIYEVEGLKYMTPTHAPNAPIYEVDVNTIDEMWQKEAQDFYLPKNSQDNRTKEFIEWIKQDEPIQVPEIYIDKDGAAHFINGRHRFAFVRDSGKTRTVMNIEFEDNKYMGIVGAQQLG